MILSTTHSIEGRKVVKYLGRVSGDAILDENIVRRVSVGSLFSL
jgi:uncharacterized protein YbjQ (UPF0145 family)